MTISLAGAAAAATPAAAAVDPDKVTPGLLGFLVVLGLGLATWLLLRSMNRQLKKIDFEDGAPPERSRAEPVAPDGDTSAGTPPDRTQA